MFQERKLTFKIQKFVSLSPGKRVLARKDLFCFVSRHAPRNVHVERDNYDVNKESGQSMETGAKFILTHSDVVYFPFYYIHFEISGISRNLITVIIW
jgi:hypothetical protein